MLSERSKSQQVHDANTMREAAVRAVVRLAYRLTPKRVRCRIFGHIAKETSWHAAPPFFAIYEMTDPTECGVCGWISPGAPIAKERAEWKAKFDAFERVRDRHSWFERAASTDRTSDDITARFREWYSFLDGRRGR